eukprot:5050306-Karenia_brevis.AAC.1
MGMVRRECLGIFNEVYAFVHKSYEVSIPLWPGVRKELRQFASILPLLHSDTKAVWSTDVHMSDASPYGLG